MCPSPIDPILLPRSTTCTHEQCFTFCRHYITMHCASHVCHLVRHLAAHFAFLGGCRRHLRCQSLPATKACSDEERGSAAGCQDVKNAPSCAEGTFTLFYLLKGLAFCHNSCKATRRPVADFQLRALVPETSHGRSACTAISGPIELTSKCCRRPSALTSASESRCW